jgi:hypothetical protein
MIDLLLFSCRSHFIDIGNDADRAARRNLMPPEFSPPLAPRAAKFSRLQVLRCASAVPVQHSFPIRTPSPRRNAIDRRDHMQQLAKFLKATGRRLRALGKVICHFFRKGKLGMKIAIKIPFVVEVELNFETDWERQR